MTSEVIMESKNCRKQGDMVRSSISKTINKHAKLVDRRKTKGVWLRWQENVCVQRKKEEIANYVIKRMRNNLVF